MVLASLALFFLVVEGLFCQQINISGVVLEKTSREPLVGAHISIVGSTRGAVTNSDGYFSFVSVSLNSKIAISYIGYKSDSVQIKAIRDTFLQIHLLPSTTLSEVVIKAQKYLGANENLGSTSLSIKQLERAPALFGETDILKTMALTPGVQGGAEGSTGLYVRGGSPDQNLLLLDGTVVYNASHLFGFLSVFNPDAIKNVNLIRDGFPAKYGGRLSSIVDVVMKDGNRKEHHQKISLGIIGSRLFAEGPLDKNGNITYMGAFRASYLNLLYLPNRIQYKNNKRDDFQSLWMHDINLKVTQNLSGKSKLSLSLFNAQDKWSNYDNLVDEEQKFGLTWGNQTLALRYSTQINSKTFFTSIGSVNNYSYNIQNTVTNQKGNEISNAISKASIKDFGFQGVMDRKITDRFYFNLGYEIRHQQVNPNSTTLEGEAFQEPSQNIRETEKANILSLFFHPHISISNWLFFEPGLRYSSYYINGNSFLYWEPRIKMGVTWDSKNQSLQLSITKMTQPLHLLATSGAGLPNDIWVSANSQFIPEYSWQYGLGYSLQIPDKSIRFNVETFFKKMENIIDYRPGSNLYEVPNQKWEDLVDGSGTGRAFGLELSLFKSTDRLNWWVSYTLSKSERKLPTINNNEWYPFRYDRRHDLAISLSYQLNDKWRVGSNFEYQSGSAVTLPTAAHLDGARELIFVFEGRNNARMPDYHRLDLSFTKSKTTRRKKEASWSYGVYNVYGKRNPYYIDYRIRYYQAEGNGNAFDKEVIGFGTRFWQRTIFRFVPFISYQINY